MSGFLHSRAPCANGKNTPVFNKSRLITSGQPKPSTLNPQPKLWHWRAPCSNGKNTLISYTRVFLSNRSCQIVQARVGMICGYVCVCMYVYVCVCMCMYVYVCTHTRAREHIQTSTYTQEHQHIHKEHQHEDDRLVVIWHQHIHKNINIHTRTSARTARTSTFVGLFSINCVVVLV